MRNIVTKMLIGLFVLNAGIAIAYSERMASPADKDKVLKTLVEIRDMVKQLKLDQAKAPRFDAPCYGAPGTPVPPQPAIDSAMIVRDICCCLHELIGDQGSIIDVVVTKIEELQSCCDATQVLIESKTDQLQSCCDATQVFIETKTDQLQSCCDATQVLIESRTDQLQSCCDATQVLIENRTDQLQSCCDATQELVESRTEEILSCCDGVNTTVGTQEDLFDCEDFIDLTCCDTINDKEQSIIAWLKLIYYTLNHGECEVP